MVLIRARDLDVYIHAPHVTVQSVNLLYSCSCIGILTVEGTLIGQTVFHLRSRINNSCSRTLYICVYICMYVRMHQVRKYSNVSV